MSAKFARAPPELRRRPQQSAGLPSGPLEAPELVSVQSGSNGPHFQAAIVFPSALWASVRARLQRRLAAPTGRSA